MNYADTSFLASLYVTDGHSAVARTEAAKMKAPLAFTALHRLELRNALNLAIHRSRIDAAHRDALWQMVENDVQDGFLIEVTPSASAVSRRAEGCSNFYTPLHGLRTLDILHVAAASELRAKAFFTFDQKQRVVALAQGLYVKP